jgi:PAS domain S-box-containing protein
MSGELHEEETMPSPLRILHLEDDARDAELLQALLESEGLFCHITRVETQEDFVAALEHGDFDLILADHTLPSFDGFSALKITLDTCPAVPFIFVSGTLGEEVAIEALKIGATDYVLKERLSRIVPSVQRALREAKERVERKRAEQALLESEEQWRAAFESNPTMYFMIDGTGTIASVNPFGAEQLGYQVSELLGQPVLQVFYEPDRESVRRHAATCFAQHGQTMRWEARKLRKDGTMLWVRETAKAVVLKNQPVLLVVCEDITERRHAEEALRRSEAYLAEAQRLTHTGSWAWNVATREYVYWLQELSRLFGFDPEGGIPSFEAVLQRIHPEDRDKAVETIERGIRERTDFEVD